MRLEHLLEFSVATKPIVSAGMTTAGERLVADLGGGTFGGPKLKGKVRASGADWALLCNDGTIKIDVRAVLDQQLDDRGLLIAAHNRHLQSTYSSM